MEGGLPMICGKYLPLRPVPAGHRSWHGLIHIHTRPVGHKAVTVHSRQV